MRVDEALEDGRGVADPGVRCADISICNCCSVMVKVGCCPRLLEGLMRTVEEEEEADGWNGTEGCGWYGCADKGCNISEDCGCNDCTIGAGATDCTCCTGG